MGVSPDFVALCLVGFVVLANTLGLLDRLGLKPRSTVDVAAELAIANRAIARLRHERDTARAENRALEATRSLEPVLKQIAANAELQKQVLDRLVHHNGSFAHIEDSLKTMAEGLKLVTGFIAGVVDLPVKEKP